MNMQHIKELLVAKGKTQSDLANALGRDKSAITNLLQGKRQLKASEIPLIAAFLNVSDAQVMGIEESPPTSASGLQETAPIPFQGAPSPAALQSGQISENEGHFYLNISDDAHSEQSYAMEVKDVALDLQGLLPGDMVICEPSQPVQAGDIAVVQVYDATGGAQTSLRRYQPPFLEAHSTREGFARLHEERANIAIMARIVRAIRFY